MNPRLPQRPFHNVRRIGEVVSVLAKYGLADWLSHTELKSQRKLLVGKAGEVLAEQSHAARIRLAVTELGTTYIKFGQMLSTRPDLVGQEVADELARLQHGVPPDAPEVARATIAAELRRPVDEVFAEFDSTPIGSASIGQVHRARLPDGREVVVKVQHPDIEARIRGDLEILQVLAGLAEKSAELKRYQPAAAVQEFQRSLSRELDFSREERNLQQFAANFADDPTVRFPRAISELCTSRVLTMEFITGVSLREAGRLAELGVDREELARRGATIWMDMVFRDGFFHADPHPGNLLVLPGGAIGILDCGMVGRIDETLRETIEEAMVAVANHDGAHLARLIMDLCSAPPAFDERAFSSEVADMVAFYGSQSINRFQLGGALQEMVRIISRYRLILPSSVSSLIKMFVMLEGTARLLSPAVNVLELVGSYQRRILRRRLSPRVQWQKWQRVLGEWRHIGESLPRGLNEVCKKIQHGTFDIHLEHRRLEPSVNRLVMGMITSSLFLGSAVLWSNKVPPVLGGFPVVGVLGCVLSVALGSRLLKKIWHD
ncbi:MAG TPA: AarF/ABC1/UbiB kinase family protein [Opitutaceae bacterium]|nr:AarF/ABC1/UbiB kinase family protein [Opitutaceae bacterium]